MNFCTAGDYENGGFEVPMDLMKANVSSEAIALWCFMAAYGMDADWNESLLKTPLGQQLSQLNSSALCQMLAVKEFLDLKFLIIEE